MDYSQYLKVNARNYTDISAVCKDIAKLCKTYKELRPKIETFTHNNGSQQSLINLTGTIPVFYKGRQYNIPIRVVILEKHPVMAPYVFVQPTSTMSIKQGRHVDANGKVYLPYLSEWKKGRHDLKGLIEILCTVFGQAPPVVANRNLAPARPAQPPPQPTGQPPVMTHTPYPTGQSAYPTQPPAFPAYPTQVSGVTGPPSHSYSQPPPYPQQSFGQPYQTTPSYPAQPPPVQQPPVQQPHLSQDNDAIIVESIRSAVADAISRRSKSIETELNIELQTLTQTEVELKAGRNRIQEIKTLLDSEQSSVASTITDLESKIAQVKSELDGLETSSKCDPDEIIQPSTPIFKQIFNAHAREQAIEDAIYNLNKALARDTIDCDTFLKYVRIFAREQFEKKETVIKAREVARLRI